MRRILDIIEGVTARSARPDLVLATISSMVAAVIVLALSERQRIATLWLARRVVDGMQCETGPDLFRHARLMRLGLEAP